MLPPIFIHTPYRSKTTKVCFWFRDSWQVFSQQTPAGWCISLEHRWRTIRQVLAQLLCVIIMSTHRLEAFSDLWSSTPGRSRQCDTSASRQTNTWRVAWKSKHQTSVNRMHVYILHTEFLKILRMHIGFSALFISKRSQVSTKCTWKQR